MSTFDIVWNRTRLQWTKRAERAPWWSRRSCSNVFYSPASRSCGSSPARALRRGLVLAERDRLCPPQARQAAASNSARA
jgi:hypothetical protein